MLFTTKKDLFALKVTNNVFKVTDTEDGSIVHYERYFPSLTEDNIPELIDKFKAIVDFRKAREDRSECKASRVIWFCGQIMQLQIVKDLFSNDWIAMYFDTDLNYRTETRIAPEDLNDYLVNIIQPVKAIPCRVYRNSFCDCTRNGISSNHEMLYILSEDGWGSPSDIRELVELSRYKDYVSVKPVYKADRWYMMGGNYVCTSDSRWEKATGTKYPIPVHDRCEE